MSIQSRITRGIGFGAMAVAMLGYASEEVAVPEVFSGGGGGTWYKYEASRKRNKQDDEFILIVMMKNKLI